MAERAVDHGHRDVAIIGGGICGVLAARECQKRGLTYEIFEKESQLGGNWYTKANAHSYLQAYEPMYRWDDNYRVNNSIFGKAPAGKVKSQLDRFISDHKIHEHAKLQTEVLSVKHPTPERFEILAQNLTSGEIIGLRSDFVCVTCGLLSDVWTAEERGVKQESSFEGEVTMAGRHNSVDSLAGSQALNDKQVVIMGSGSFAIEAAEAAARQQAASITIVSRPRFRWVMPFSRQFLLAAIAFTPLVPWDLKMKGVEWYLRKFFFKPCGLNHWLPSGSPADIDYSGQSNDGYFRLAFEGRLQCIVDKVKRLEGRDVVLESGQKLPCDLFVVAAGYKYNLQPGFLKDLGLGFQDLHAFAFLGKNPRIGTASDFVFSFVPSGPMKQLEMFFHSVECCRRGLEEEVRAVLEPTALPDHTDTNMKGGRMSGSHTWFQTRSPYANLNISIEERCRLYINVLSVGRSFLARQKLRAQLELSKLGIWTVSSVLGIAEILKFPVFGPGVVDHHVPAMRNSEKAETRPSFQIHACS